MDQRKWAVKRLNIAILATDGKSFRKVAWVKTTSGGIYCGIALVGIPRQMVTKISYHANGELYSGYHNGVRTKLNYPPIAEIKGIQPFFVAGIGWHQFLPEFPFKRIDEAIYVDVRERQGLSCNFALMEPLAYDALKGLRLDLDKMFIDTHIHILTRTKPWIVIWTY